MKIISIFWICLWLSGCQSVSSDAEVLNHEEYSSAIQVESYEEQESGEDKKGSLVSQSRKQEKTDKKEALGKKLEEQKTAKKKQIEKKLDDRGKINLDEKNVTGTNHHRSQENSADNNRGSKAAGSADSGQKTTVKPKVEKYRVEKNKTEKNGVEKSTKVKPNTKSKNGKKSDRAIETSPYKETSPGKSKNNHAQKPLKKKVPALEDSEGFDGRRPLWDPLAVGESMTLSLSYFKVEAGRFTLSIKPFKKVNGKKAYHFHYDIKSSRLFSLFYRVEDTAETFVEYSNWRPISYEIHVDETKQIRETKSYFDWEKGLGFYFDRKKAPKTPVKVTKKEWPILPWSQNVFSAVYYLRSHTLRVGKTFKVRVGHEGKNMLMSAKVLRKETLKTKLGSFEAFVIKPTFTVDGLFKPTGENFLWLSADDRKFVLRMESKVKIGTIVGEIEALKK